MKLKNSLCKILLALLGLGFLFAAAKGCVYVEMGLFAAAAGPENIDLESIADGEYTGRYTCGLVSARVSVTVQDHRITGIEILDHVYKRGKPGEGVIDSVIREQRLDVDVISGATISSKVILNSIGYALKGK
jgi:uncharacterized protein with FMN-binding domain